VIDYIRNVIRVGLNIVQVKVGEEAGVNRHD